MIGKQCFTCSMQDTRYAYTTQRTARSRRAAKEDERQKRRERSARKRSSRPRRRSLSRAADRGAGSLRPGEQPTVGDDSSGPDELPDPDLTMLNQSLDRARSRSRSRSIADSLQPGTLQYDSRAITPLEGRYGRRRAESLAERAVRGMREAIPAEVRLPTSASKLKDGIKGLFR